MNGRRILVVDDRHDSRYLLRALLQGRGYEVDEACNGAEALARARQVLPDLIISDILMPVMDGFSLCRELKADERLKAIPFIFYTATYTDDRDRRFGLSLGAEQFLVKPEEPDVLVAAIEDTLGQAGGVAAGQPPEGEPVYLREYNEVLVRKLEAKVEQLAFANRELEQKIAERKRTEEALLQAQKMESVGRLAGGVAHDFNNLLHVILGQAEFALRSLPGDSPVRGNLEEIQKAAQRSANLTRQLLAFARRQAVSLQLLDLNQAVEAMLTMLRRLIGENIDLAWRPGQNLGSVRMDPSQLDQILVNLCVNARDAIQGTGRVTIQTEAVVVDRPGSQAAAGLLPGEYLLLSVTDDGCGMDAGTLSHLFEPFFSTKAGGRGTGLGLATVYGIVKQNHGFIDVSSQPGRGSTFRIYLPRHEGIRAPTPAEAPVRTHGGGETILLVEDEPAVLDLTRLMLEQQGYSVLAASTPADAVRVAEAHAGGVDLLITDVVMPGMDGRDLCAMLLARRPHLKCLYMSGYTADAIAQRGVVEEGVRFLQKPYSIRELSAKVREVLDA